MHILKGTYWFDFILQNEDEMEKFKDNLFLKKQRGLGFRGCKMGEFTLVNQLTKKSSVDQKVNSWQKVNLGRKMFFYNLLYVWTLGVNGMNVSDICFKMNGIDVPMNGTCNQT